jgi:adenylosuccinate lyase
MVRDEAYRLVQEGAQRAWDEGTEFRELIGEAAPDLDLDALFDYDAFVRHVPELIARLDSLKGR